MVSCGVHQKHAEQHDVSSDATSLGVVDLKGDLWPNLDTLYIVEAIAVSSALATKGIATYLT